MKPTVLAAALTLAPLVAMAASPAPTVESLQKEIATLRAQNTICSADLSRVMQDRVALVESLANSNVELEKTKAALTTATAGLTKSTVQPSATPKAGAVSTPTVAPPSEPPKGARR